MKSTRIVGIIIALLLPLFALSQSGSTFWYNVHGQRQMVYRQADVFACRLDTAVIYLGNLPSSIVRKAYTRAEADALTIVEFVPGLLDSAYEEVRSLIRMHPSFECEFDVVNLAPDLPNTVQGWSPIDEQIMVTFRDPHFSATDIAAFETRHHLQLSHAPYANLPDGYSHCHIFKATIPFHCESGNRTIDACQRIWETDSANVMIVEPNLVRAFAGESNDTLYNQLWYIENTAQGPLAEGNVGGTYDADHDINWVWGLGLKGAGTRVAVVDFDGFDLQHEDMQGVFVAPWDAITSQVLPVGNQIGEFHAHGMCVSGIIGARADNVHGVAGVAPECEIVPIQANGQMAVVVTGVQKAQDTTLHVDVINLSLGTGYDYSTLQNELINAKRTGRNGKGIIVVASAGNKNNDTLFYPAAYPEVIGVVASAPDDKRKSKNGLWNGWILIDWGSNYSNRYDVAAGGTLMPTTDHSSDDGYNRGVGRIGDYQSNFAGTSAAAPIVSGVCALLLQANPNLVDTGNGTWQVRDAIRAGAEKVHPTFYDYNAYPLEPGRSLEMSYGRLNAMNSLQLVGVAALSQPTLATLSIQLSHDEQEFLAVYELPSHTRSPELVGMDIFGKEVFHLSVSSGSRMQTHSLAGYSKGVYITYIQDQNGRLSNTVRFAYY